MASLRRFQQSFSGGEVTPEFFGRVDDPKYQSGVATMRNFIALPHGPAVNRPGTKFVRAAKDSTRKVRLIPFSWSAEQTMVIELGHLYARFHTNGGTLMRPPAPAWDSGADYTPGQLVSYLGEDYACIQAHSNQLPTSGADVFWHKQPATGEYEIYCYFNENRIFDVHYAQAADVITFVHPQTPVFELRRKGAYEWAFVAADFSAPLAAPTNIAGTASGTGTIDYSYTVTAVTADGVESTAGTPVSVLNNLLTPGNANIISWDAVTGASRYRVYKLSAGIYGFIGESPTSPIVDDNIAPDLGRTPPIYEDITSGNRYPAAVAHFEQRKVFGGAILEPQHLHFSRLGTDNIFSYSIPLRDEDRIRFRIASREINAIRHIVPLADLVLFTNSGEWRVTSVNSDAITALSVSVKPQAYVGANNVQPVTVNNNVVYCAARGGHVRELGYQWEAQGFATGDLSIRAPHLFDGRDIVDMAYAKAPWPIVWCVSSNGHLLGLTYMPEQKIGAWHRHDTDGVIESVCVVIEGDEDALYLVVKRTVGGVPVRYIERMASRLFDEPKDGFFVDCGLTYTGAPATVISGLDHLEGKEVAILADGAVHPRQTVSSGQITLEDPASKVHIGLPITADLQTLPMAIALRDGSFGQGRMKNINKAWLRVHRSSGIFVGPSEDRLTEAKQRTTEPYGSPPALKSEEIPIVITPSWAESGQVFVRQADPLPLTLVGMTLEVTLGG